MLVCRDIDVVYDGAQVLFGVDFDVEEGEIVALLGTNGAGKSTLLRAIAGIQQASNGAIFLDGDDITHLPPHDIAKRGVVMMPGGNAIFPTLTVEENLQMAALMNRRERTDTKERLRAVLSRFPRLRERWNVRAGSLSGGEQQMIGLAQALLMKPRLLMIDELSLGLAPQVVEMLLETLREINRQGTTVIIVEQSINVALQIAERAVFMEKGEVRFDGPTSELLANPDIVRSVFLAGRPTSELATPPCNAARGGSRNHPRRLRPIVVLRRADSAPPPEPLGRPRRGRGRGRSQRRRQDEPVRRDRRLRPDLAGDIAFLDRNVTRLSPDARARLGMARSYQNVRLFPALTVRENIAVALERHEQAGIGMLASIWSPTTRGSERRLDNLVESLGLGAYADKFVNELSTGTRRIVDIACQLAASPKLLLLDEPSSGLAQAETEQLGPVIRRIVKETGCGVLIIEHDLGLVASLSDRLVAMRLGAVMKEAHRRDVLGDQEVIDAILGGASKRGRFDASRQLGARWSRNKKERRQQGGSMAEAAKGGPRPGTRGWTTAGAFPGALRGDRHQHREGHQGQGTAQSGWSSRRSSPRATSCSRTCPAPARPCWRGRSPRPSRPRRRGSSAPPTCCPSDITGSSVVDMTTREFKFRAGPVFTNILLADEINRATPKTQSALLEAMQERRVSVDGVTHPLPKPFLLLATQNPIELAGTFPLPEAQLDRFLFKISLGYPDETPRSRC